MAEIKCDILEKLEVIGESSKEELKALKEILEEIDIDELDIE